MRREQLSRPRSCTVTDRMDTENHPASMAMIPVIAGIPLGAMAPVGNGLSSLAGTATASASSSSSSLASGGLSSWMGGPLSMYPPNIGYRHQHPYCSCFADHDYYVRVGVPHICSIPADDITDMYDMMDPYDSFMSSMGPRSIRFPPYGRRGISPRYYGSSLYGGYPGRGRRRSLSMPFFRYTSDRFSNFPFSG